MADGTASRLDNSTTHEPPTGWMFGGNSTGHAKFIGRVGALAVALGVGVAVATGGTGLARAEAESTGDQGTDAASQSSAQSADASDPADDTQDPADGGDGGVDGSTPDGDTHQADGGMEVSASGVDTSSNDTGQSTDSSADAASDDDTAVDPDPVGLQDDAPADVDAPQNPSASSGSDAHTPTTPDSGETGPPLHVVVPDDAVRDHSSLAGTATAAGPAARMMSQLNVSPTNGVDEDQSVATAGLLAAQDTDSEPAQTVMAVPGTIIGLATAFVGALLSPFLAPGPTAPAQPPLVWALLGWVSREIQRTFFNRTPTAVADEVTTSEDVSTVIHVLPNDSDLDEELGDVLTIGRVTQPEHGTVTVNADGTLTYTPDEDFNGVDTFSYTVTDETGSWHLHGLFGFFGGGHTSEATVTVHVTQVNDAPVANDDSASTSEDTAVSGNVLVNDTDVDGDDLTLVAVGSPDHGSLMLNTDGSFTYTPNENFNGTDSFTYSVFDGDKQDTATVTITVGAVEDTPVAENDSYTTDEDTALNVPIPGVLGNDSDADGDDLTVVVDDGPDNGTLTLNPNGSFTYTPNENFNGTDTFTYTLSDGNGGGDSATVTITINPVNDAPTAPAIRDVGSYPEGSYLGGNVGADDIDGDTLTYELVDPPDHAQLTLNPDGSLIYASDPDYAGTDSFKYRVFDGQAYSNVATVTIHFDPVNDAPVANDDSVSTPEDTALSGNVVGNDTDVDDDTVAVASVDDQPDNGSLSLDADGSFTYTPNENFNGTDSFTYSVSDGNGLSDSATVTITVNPVNDAPTAADRNEGPFPEGSFLGGTIGGSDVDGDQLTVELVSPPQHAQIQLNPDGSLIYASDPDFVGTDSFKYRVFDGQAYSNEATVTLRFDPVNDPPTARDDSATVAEDGAVTVNVRANDTDVEGDALNAPTVASGPANGTAQVNADGTITYRPNLNFNGTDSFTYSVSDVNGAAATATVNITVTPVNDAPTVVGFTDFRPAGTNVFGALNATDVDGDTLTFELLTEPSQGQLTFFESGGFFYFPNASVTGTVRFTYRVTDGTVYSPPSYYEIIYS